MNVSQFKNRVIKTAEAAKQTVTKLAKLEDRVSQNITNKLTKFVKGDKPIRNSNPKSVRKNRQTQRKNRRQRTQANTTSDLSVMEPTIIRKKEFITNINGSTTFAYTNYSVTPQNPQLFPWGSKVLPNFEMYKLRSCKFTFKTTTGDLNPSNAQMGVIIMGLVYDPDDPLLTDQVAMLNYQGFKETKISNDLTISWVPRNNPLPIRYVNHNLYSNAWNDCAMFYIATNGNPFTTICGQLWVEYEMELFIPRPSNFFPGVMYGSTASIGAGTYYMFDSNTATVNQTFGDTALATITQQAGMGYVCRFNQPGYYLVLQSFWCSNTALCSAFNAPNTNYANCNAISLNPSNVTYNFDWDYDSLQYGFSSSTGGSGHCLRFINATSAYVAGATSFSNASYLTTTHLGTVSSGLYILQVPNLSSGTQIPIVPEFTKNDIFAMFNAWQHDSTNKNSSTSKLVSGPKQATLKDNNNLDLVLNPITQLPQNFSL
jgi:hypothetical protein